MCFFLFFVGNQELKTKIMSRLIVMPGVELPTFSPALGPESVKNKAPAVTKIPNKSPVLKKVKSNDQIHKVGSKVDQSSPFYFGSSFVGFESQYNEYNLNTFSGVFEVKKHEYEVSLAKKLQTDIFCWPTQEAIVVLQCKRLKI